jgi:hypothetical protein
MQVYEAGSLKLWILERRDERPERIGCSGVLGPSLGDATFRENGGFDCILEVDSFLFHSLWVLS